MQKQFFGAGQEILLEANFDIDRAIIFLPGISGKAHSERFSGLAKVAEDAGYACARVRIWDDEEQAQALSYELIFAQLDEVIEALKRIGFIDFAIIGKSFGGGVALAYEHELVTQKILWAPAIGVTDKEGNFADVKSVSLATVNDLKQVLLGEAELQQQKAAVSIIHGSADTVFPLENSEQIMRALEGEVQVVEGADHSFKDPFHEAKLLEITEALLK